MKFLIIILSIFITTSAISDTYMCHFSCDTDKNQTCSHYYHRIDTKSFYEDQKQRVFEARENEDHLLLTRIGFPTEEGNLPEYVFIEHVYINKFNNLAFHKYGFNNDNIKVIESKAGRCKFQVFENPLLTK
ncbi:hypothetical protein N9Y50_02880 [Alphaproteobacteria bacterium]|nr:hypothetical protein [Alphaproteobacteria bacterium]